MRRALWYFDFISPFAWIALNRLKELPADLEIEYRPVLFAGILQHWGQKGPAEMETKRRYTYRWVHWWAAQLGVPLRFPAAHPFNPLHHLRLCIACGSTPEAIRTIYESIWTTGEDAADPARFGSLLGELGKSQDDLQKTQVKDQLRTNTEDAIKRGVFGVPTLEIDGELFWGADAMEFARAFLKDSAVLHNAEMRRLDGLPVAAARKQS
jgi:2-hydroxychromene-2-carboxylate isomerase